MTVLLVAAAAVVGVLARWELTRLSWRPLGTFIANVTGALAVGLIASKTGNTQTVLGLAGLGAFTTVSGLVDDAATMSERGRPQAAVAYVASTAVLGIAAAWIGMTIGA